MLLLSVRGWWKGISILRCLQYRCYLSDDGRSFPIWQQGIDTLLQLYLANLAAPEHLLQILFTMSLT